MSELNRREFAAALAASACLRDWRTLSFPAQAPAINPPSASALGDLSRWMEMGGAPGLSLGVVQGGKLVWERYEGVSDASSKQPVTRDSLFPAASLGKPVAALGALLLVDLGKLDLDRPLKSYVPDHTPADARGDLVTPRHVLSHSTGYRNWRNSPDQLLVPDFDPGSRFQYSGEGFYYLQRVLEKVSGHSFEQHMEAAVFAPLGMKSSTYGWRADTDARLVTGHNRGQPARPPNREFAVRLLQYAQQQNKSFASFTHEDIVAAMTVVKPAPATLPNFIFPNAAGSLLTTVTDYAAFLNALLASTTAQSR
jgi:CubicO group peptidase (beta-lactamase class C family)